MQNTILNKVLLYIFLYYLNPSCNNKEDLSNLKKLFCESKWISAQLFTAANPNNVYVSILLSFNTVVGFSLRNIIMTYFWRI